MRRGGGCAGLGRRRALPHIPRRDFHGMVAKAKAGELNLVRTIWGLRQAKAARERGVRTMH